MTFLAQDFLIWSKGIQRFVSVCILVTFISVPEGPCISHFQDQILLDPICNATMRVFCINENDSNNS